MSFADFLENEVLDQLFGALDYAEPASVYFALSTTTPNDDGTNFTEPVGNGYVRLTKDNDKVTWTTASGGALDNAIALTFATASGGSWGTVTHFGIYDAVSGGNQMAWGTLPVSKTINDGDTAEFAIGALDITLD